MSEPIAVITDKVAFTDGVQLVRIILTPAILGYDGVLYRIITAIISPLRNCVELYGFLNDQTVPIELPGSMEKTTSLAKALRYAGYDKIKDQVS